MMQSKADQRKCARGPVCCSRTATASALQHPRLIRLHITPEGVNRRPEQMEDVTHTYKPIHMQPVLICFLGGKSDLFMLPRESIQSDTHAHTQTHTSTHTHKTQTHTSGLLVFPGTAVLFSTKPENIFKGSGGTNQAAATRRTTVTCMESLPLFLLVRHTVDGQRSTGVNCRENTSWYTSNLVVMAIFQELEREMERQGGQETRREDGGGGMRELLTTPAYKNRILQYLIRQCAPRGDCLRSCFKT